MLKLLFTPIAAAAAAPVRPQPDPMPRIRWYA